MTDNHQSTSDAPGSASTPAPLTPAAPPTIAPSSELFERMPARLGRLPAPLRAELDGARAILYDEITGGARANGPFPLVDDEGRLLGPFAAMLANPVVGEAIQQLGVAIRTSTSLAPREREIAVLEVARAERSEYESWAHERVARSIGMTGDEIVALQHGEDAQSLSETEALVRKVAASLCALGSLDEALFEEATATLGRVALADLVHLVGYYRMLSLGLAAWEVPAPAAERPADPRGAGSSKGPPSTG